MKKLLLMILLAASLLLPPGCLPEEEPIQDAKPVIYLYPQEEMEVVVALDYHGTLTTTWPHAPEGLWQVTARPDGTLLHQGEEYSYLFWEGSGQGNYDLSQGFVVAGEDTGAFLRRTLSQMGLTPREYNEFIVYWLPLMEGNPYNLISFQQEAYTSGAELTVTPQPDSILRVFMAWAPLSEPVELPPQKLPAFHRKGFTLVEWGDAQVSL